MQHKRTYQTVRLAGRDRPFRAPGKLIHVFDIVDGKPLHSNMSICGRIPRDESIGFEPVKAAVTCERCKERMR
jgi:hypothetical protein